MPANRIVFLFDVDNTLLDSDRVTADLKRHLQNEVGRLTTVFPRQGHYALDPKIIATYPQADITVERIGDLVNYDLASFAGTKRR